MQLPLKETLPEGRRLSQLLGKGPQGKNSAGIVFIAHMEHKYHRYDPTNLAGPILMHIFQAK